MGSTKESAPLENESSFSDPNERCDRSSRSERPLPAQPAEEALHQEARKEIREMLRRIALRIALSDLEASVHHRPVVDPRQEFQKRGLDYDGFIAKLAPSLEKLWKVFPLK